MIPKPATQFQQVRVLTPYPGEYDDAGLYRTPRQVEVLFGAIVRVARAAAGQTLDLEVNGTTFAVDAGSTPTPALVAARFVSALGIGPEPVTAAQRPGGCVEIIADDPAVPFTLTVGADLVILGSMRLVTASVQPADGEERKLLPEGVSTEEVLKLYTDSEISTVDEQDGSRAEVVEFRDEKNRLRGYDVHVVQRYRMRQLAHSKALLTRIAAGSAWWYPDAKELPVASTISLKRPFRVPVGTTPVQISAGAYGCYTVLLRFPSTNTVPVVVGDSNVVATDPGFAPSEDFTLDAVNEGTIIELSEMYAVASAAAQAVDVYPVA